MKRLLFSALGTFFALGATMALAGGSGKATQKAAGKSGMTQDDAKAAALKLVPGKIIEVERENKHGDPVFSVEIRAADGVHEVVIRIADGAVLENKSKGDHGDGDDDDDDEEEGEGEYKK